MRVRTIALIVSAFASAVCAQDQDWVRDWESAQRQRPATVASVSRIASLQEPGTPLVVHGRLFRDDGVTPAANVVVFAYHTDRSGVYNAPGARGWRLRGWARTDKEGRFEFHTIRPGSYPQGRNPSHIHLTIEGPGLSRRWTSELRFADDPYVSDRDKQASVTAGRFGSVRPVTTRNGVQHVDLNLKISNDGTF